MKDFVVYKLTGVHAAVGRLEKAVSRLEDAFESGGGPGDIKNGVLSDKLSEARHENKKLKEATVNVSERLDDAIEKLSKLMES